MSEQAAVVASIPELFAEAAFRTFRRASASCDAG